jgi:hypothetical protein
MLFTYASYPRTTDAVVNHDLGPHDPIPPEAWRDCGGGQRLVKRRVVLDGGNAQTVAVCAKCGAIIETLENRTAHPKPPVAKPTTPPINIHQAIVDFLRTEGPATSREIAGALGITVGNASWHCQVARDVKRVGDAVNGTRRKLVYVWGLA